MYAEAAMAKGKAVKEGSTSNEYAQVCSAASDKMIGVAQSTPTAAGDPMEVAVNGGGKGLAQTTIAMGDLLTAHSDGALKPVSSGEYYIAQAMQDAVANDLFDIKIVSGIY